MKKIPILVALLFSLFSLLNSWNTFAGIEVGNGGDAVICQGKKPVVLDYLYASMPNPLTPKPEIETIDGLAASEVISLFRNKVKDTLFGESFDRALGEIGDLNQWILADGLTDINDDGLGFQLPKDCKLAQVAVRTGAAVYVERSIIEQMDPSQLGILVVHEVLYKLAAEKGKTTSATTRHVVRALIQRSLSQPVVEAAVKQLGWTYSHFDLLSDQPGQNKYYTNGSYSGYITILAIDPIDRTVFLSFHYGREDNLQPNTMWLGYFQCDYSNRCSPDFNRYHAYFGNESMRWVEKGDFLRFVGNKSLEKHQIRDGRHYWSKYRKP